LGASSLSDLQTIFQAFLEYGEVLFTDDDVADVGEGERERG
jgi:hypothetical protein